MSSILNEKQAGSVDTTPLFWNRMLRFSIYFTILGVGLGFILGKMVHQAFDEANAEELAKPKMFVERVDADGNLLDNQSFSPADFVGLPEGVEAHSEVVSDILGRPKPYPVWTFISPFFVFGVLSILMCLFMRKRERKVRAESNR